MLVVGHRVPRRHSSTSGSHPTNPLASVRGANPLRTCGFPPAYPLLVASPGGAFCGRRLRGTHRGEAGPIGGGCTPGESAWVLPAGRWSKTLLLGSSRSIFSPATAAASRYAVRRAHLGPVVPRQGDAAQDAAGTLRNPSTLLRIGPVAACCFTGERGCSAAKPSNRAIAALGQKIGQKVQQHRYPAENQVG